MTAQTAAGDAALAQATLIESLLDPACYPHAVDRVKHLETHISHVLLTGGFAYKIKKPVSFGFLDFGTLDRRRHYCEEELRLNRRLAPALYLAVLPVTGTPRAPRVGGDGEAIEYAVKMVEFPQEALLDRKLARGDATPAAIDELADAVAAFHGRVDRAPAGARSGTPAAVWAPVAQNFSQLGERLPGLAWAARLDRLATWSREQFSRLAPLIEARRLAGRTRECHGDLHPGNVAIIDERPEIFDCIEFNPELRWIDVINEVAFMAMDLSAHGRPDYARRFVNRYLEDTGDYGALALLAFYAVYRALVRAKVAAIRAAQENAGQRQQELALCERYLDIAEGTMRPAVPRLFLMHGLSGAGKSHVSQWLVEGIGAVRLRSDVERKRLAGMAPLATSRSPLLGGIYDREATVATYGRLADLARVVLGAGYPVVVDAASLQSWQRRPFRDLADELAVPFLIVDCRAAEITLHRRLARRRLDAADASEADARVLEQQRRTREPLDALERQCTLAVDTERLVPEELLRRLAAALATAEPV